MHIAVLGPLEVRNDTGEPVPVPGAKERLLLALLSAGTPDAVSVDRLIDGLWDGDRPHSARSSLHVHLVRLRSALEPQRPRGSPGRYVVRRGAGYSLAAAGDELDVLGVGEMVARGRALLAAGDAAGAVEALTAALDLWRGEPYEDWPDAPFAAAERERLGELRAGALSALLEAQLTLGKHAEVIGDLRGLLAADPLREDLWRLLVLALYRSGRQGDALAALQRARRALAEELGADPGPELRALEQAVLAQDPALDARGAVGAASSVGRPLGGPEPTVAVCPYKGLATYQATDAGLFHGRERMVTRLVARLVDAPLVAVSGSSGAGKSSLVRAGLLPALARGALPGSTAWTAVVVTPGRHPVDALTVLAGDDPPGAPVVLVCDQLEELWASGVHPGERAAFLDTMLALLDDGVVVRCVVAVRGDHVGRLAEHAALAERLGSAVVLVPPFTEAELRDVVRGPAGAVGLTVEDELVDAVVADVLGRPGALPLLSTALVGTWERRRGDRLTLAGYLEAGGVAGSLTSAAEAAWTALDDEEREVARRLLVRLADTDEGGSLVRRPAPLAELDLDGDRGGMRRTVIDAFVARRLLSLDEERLDVAHEALLTGWPRLARWLDDDAAGRAVRRHLTPAAQEWQRRGRPQDELYRGARLGAALDWAGSADDELTAGEREFLDASKARADAELRAAQQRALTEARGRRRLRWLAAGLAAVLVVALGTAVLAVRSQRAADRATAVAEDTSLVADANRLAALSRTTESLDLTYLLAAQGFRLRNTPETWDALLGSLVEHRRVLRTETFGGGGPLGSLADGGRTVFIGHPITGQIFSWPVDSPAPPRLVEAAEGWEGWRAMAPSPTDPLLLTAGTDASGLWVRTVDAGGAVREVFGGAEVGWEPIGAAVLPDGRRARLIVAQAGDAPQATWRLIEVDLVDGTTRDTGVRGTAPAPLDEILRAALSDDGTVAVLSGSSPTVEFADLERGRQVSLEAPTDDPATYFEYRALPTGAALLGSDGDVRLYDRDGRIRQRFDALPGQMNDLDVAPDGTWGVTTGAEGAIKLWNIDAATGRWSEKEVLAGARGVVGTSMIDPSGTRMYTLSSDRMLLVWDVSPGGGFGAPRSGLTDRWITDEPAVVQPGKLVVVPTRPYGSAVPGNAPYQGPGTAEVAATFLDPRTGRVVDEVPIGKTLEPLWSGASVAASPGGSLIAVSSGHAVTVLDAKTRAAVATLPVPAAGVRSASGSLPEGVVGPVAWSADGSRLFVGVQAVDVVDSLINPFAAERGGTLVAVDRRTWQVTDTRRVAVVPEAVQVSPDGATVAVAGGNGDTVLILDASTLDPRSTVHLRQEDQPSELTFSRDGRLLLVGGSGVLHVIDTASGRAREPAAADVNGGIQQIEWLPDGRTVVVSGGGGLISFFDVVRGLVRTAPLPASPDGGQGTYFLVPRPTHEVAVLGDRERVMSYPVTTAAWLRTACDIAGRDLTRAEWERYLPGREYASTCTDLG